MALRPGNAPCGRRAHSVRGTRRSLCTLTTLTLTPSPRSRVHHARRTSEETAALSSGRTATKQRRRAWDLRAGAGPGGKGWRGEGGATDDPTGLARGAGLTLGAVREPPDLGFLSEPLLRHAV